MVTMTTPPFDRGWLWYRAFLIIYTLMKTAQSFTSCAPPRFHIFSEKIVASWHAPADSVQAVEEVMRSCGGAVQGVREIPLASCLYLNRADDGFAFFDCGTYTHGPVTLSQDTETLFTTSLALSTKSRVFLSCTLDTNEKRIKPEIVSCLYRVSFGNDGTSLKPEDFRVNIMEPTHDIFWQQQLQCSMSSPGQQPWMLQRAKWEQNGLEWPSPDFGPSNTLQAWATVAQSASDPNVDDNINMDGMVCTIGVWCTETKSVKAVARKYNRNGMLVQVALQTGTLMQDSKVE